MIAKKLNCKQVQWPLYLVRFDFDLHYYLDKFMDKLFQRLNHSNGLCDNKNVILFKPEYLVVYIIEELVFKEEECSLLLNICQSNRASQQEKLVAYTTRKLCQSFFRLI